MIQNVYVSKEKKNLPIRARISGVIIKINTTCC